MSESCCAGGRGRVVVIVGAGAAGTIVAAQLVRREPSCQVVLVDPSARPGPGVAYGTTNFGHLLNVRSGRMSAFADEPEHFTRWLRARSRRPAGPSAFAPRAVYGVYLEDLLVDVIGTGRARIRRASVTDVEEVGAALVVRTTAGDLAADAVVLALGNGAPAALPWEVEHGRAPWCVPDPWAAGAFDGLGEDRPVVVVGTGLTAVDVTVTLAAQWDRQVVAVSRHGLLPTRHLTGAEPVWPTAVPAGTGAVTLRALVASVRSEVAAAAAIDVDWRAVVDGLRPAVASLWARMPVAQRQAFLGHVARFWDVHRHRTAPEVADQLDELRERGRFEVRTGTPLRVAPDGAGCRVLLPDGRGGTQWLRAAGVVNCTGPGGVLAGHGDPLVRQLCARGLARADPLGLGLDVAAGGGLVDRGGRVSSRLLTVGALRKPALWESTAIPEIRQQAADLAGRLSAVLSTTR